MRHKHVHLRGFSLIEILIGMAIAMLTILIMLQAMSVAEGYRRTATTGGDAQSNGAVAMYSLQRDLRLSGYGLVTTETDGALARCASGTTFANNNGTAFSFGGGLAPPFAPFVINPPGVPAGDPGSDIIEVLSSGSVGMVGYGIPVARIAANAYQATGSRGGFRHGDLILIVGQPGEPCSMVEITRLPQDGSCGDLANNNPVDAAWIVHDSAGTPYFNIHANACGTQITSRWNPAIEPFTYTTGKAYNLGPAAHPELATPIVSGLSLKLYAVRNGRLTTCDMLSSACTVVANACNTSTPSTCNDNVWIPISDDIVVLKALYGMDDGVSGGVAGDGIVDSWLDSNQIDTVTFTHMPPSFASWGQLMAGRIAVVSRSKQFEKNAVTTANINWNDNNSTINLALTSPLATPTDWQHYRYRSFETKVPFRNMIWKN